MSYPTPLAPPPPAPTKRVLWPWIALAAVVALAMVAGVVALTFALLPSRPTAKVTGTPTVNAQPVQALPATPASEATPDLADFKLTPKITDKQCFGSAGCNVTLRVNVEYSGPALSDDTTWLIVYEIRGVDDGPQVGNLRLTGGQYEATAEDVSTKSAKTKITVKAVSIDQD